METIINGMSGDAAFWNNLADRAGESRALRKQLAADSFYLFARMYFSEAMGDPTAEFQMEIFRILEQETRPFALAAFRGSGKSLICTQLFPLFSMMMKGTHNTVIFSATQRQAQEHLGNILLSLEENPILKKDFGSLKRGIDSWGRDFIVVSRYDAKITAASIETSVRGLKYKHYRPQLLVVDDIEDVNSVRTQESRDKAFHYVQSEIIPLGGPGTRLVFVGNLLHPNSAMMRLKNAIEAGKMTGVWREYPLQGENGVIIWPERFTPEVFAAERGKYIEEIDFEREMNLKFISASDTVVEREWIQYYDRLPDAQYLNRFVIGVDPAISEKQSADDSGIVTCMVCNRGMEMKLFVFPHPFHAKVNFPALVDEIRHRHAMLAMNLRRIDVIIEDVNYQASLPQYLETLNEMNIKGFHVPHNRDKRSKIAILGYLIKLGKIVFPREGCEFLIEQLVGFGKERHDDVADALALIAFSVFSESMPIITFPRPYVGAGDVSGESPRNGIHLESDAEIKAALKDPEIRSMLELEVDLEASRREEAARRGAIYMPSAKKPNAGNGNRPASGRIVF